MAISVIATDEVVASRNLPNQKLSEGRHFPGGAILDSTESIQRADVKMKIGYLVGAHQDRQRASKLHRKKI